MDMGVRSLPASNLLKESKELMLYDNRRKVYEVWVQKSLQGDSFMRAFSKVKQLWYREHGDESDCELACMRNQTIRHIQAFDPMTHDELTTLYQEEGLPLKEN